MVDFSTAIRRSLGLIVIFVLVTSLVSAGAVSQGDDRSVEIVEQEPNDARANATPITNTGLGRNGEFAGGTVSGTLDNTIDEERNAISDPDVDFFRFNANRGQAVNFYLGSTDFTATNVTLYDPSGGVVARGIEGPGDIFTYGGVVDETGTYYFRLRTDTEFAESSDKYNFHFEIADPDSFEPNDGLDAATSVDASSQVNGTIAKGDTDVFAVEADAGENISAGVSLRDLLTDNPGNVAVDILGTDGERLNKQTEDEFGGWANATGTTGVAREDTETVNTTVEDAGTYYVRIAEAPGSNDFTDIGGFVPYAIDLNVSGKLSQNTENTLVIVGGSPENKVSYEFTHEGGIERSGESHGAPIADRHVTVDPDVDTISNGHVSGRLGGGGDAYLVSGAITGFELDGDAEVYLNGEEVDPTRFGDIPDRDTATATETPTTTRTSTPTPTETETRTPTPTRTATATDSPTGTPSLPGATETSTAGSTTTASGTSESTPGGEILGGTTESSDSSGPGFGLVVALVALLAVALLGTRRH